MVAELLLSPQPAAPPQIQTPPAFVSLNFRPGAPGPRPWSASRHFSTELLLERPYAVPLAEPFATCDLDGPTTGRRPRLSALTPSQFTWFQPPETSGTRLDARPPADDTGPDFLDDVFDLEDGGRLPLGVDGYIRDPKPNRTGGGGSQGA
jgi:hypothetical protein